MSSPATFVATRRVGDAQVSIISEGSMRWAPTLQAPEAEWRRAIPEADAAGVITLGLNSAVIQAGDAVIVVDPGFADPADDQAAGTPSHVIRSPGLAAGMATLGLPPEAVTHVVITHAHWDHYAGVVIGQGEQRRPRFPNARHLLGLAEWGGGTDSVPTEAAVRLGPIEAAGLLDLAGDEQAVTPDVTLIPAPGESPGHVIVRVTSQGATWYHLGDLFHHACEVAHPAWTSPGRDDATMLTSRRRFLAQAAAERAIATYTHAPFPGWGRVVPEGEGYRWETAGEAMP